MTQQIAGTELRFTQGFAAAERQVLTDEAVEFLAELVGNSRRGATSCWRRVSAGSKISIAANCRDLFRKPLPFVKVTGRSAAFRKICVTAGSRSPGRLSARW